MKIYLREMKIIKLLSNMKYRVPAIKDLKLHRLRPESNPCFEYPYSRGNEETEYTNKKKLRN